ncbi:CD180 antigen-like [Ostrea edulis]|uniref:CD180 antigen-like n=1 Tax=Ostrea edulis TaxID=37623 RepID=UPI0024AE985E|nr:CD180 antigen-like [Ostrea edulis]
MNCEKGYSNGTIRVWVMSVITVFGGIAFIAQPALSARTCSVYKSCTKISFQNISNLSTENFDHEHKKWKKIKCINLQDDIIYSIQAGLFSKFSSLRTLQMQNISKLGEHLIDGFENINSTKLTHLCLQSVGLTGRIVLKLCELLPRRLKVLVLRNNEIGKFALDYISGFKVSTLDLSSNKNLNFSLGISKPYTWLNSLNLSRTSFYPNSTFLFNKTCVIPNLKHLALIDNQLRLSALDGHDCLKHLKKLSLSGSQLVDGIHNYSFSRFPELTDLQIDGLRNTVIQLPTFQNNHKLENLNLNSMKYLFPPSSENVLAFKHLSRLQKLRMKRWDLSTWNSLQLSSLFAPFSKSITLLDLSYVGITAIPDILWEMQNLTTLDLNSNKISRLDIMSNTTNKKLDHLHLMWNQIESLDPKFLPSSVTDLNLTGNPFSCSCQLIPFVIWVKEKEFVKIQNDWHYGRYRCATPRDWEGKSLATFVRKIKPTDCAPFNAYIITAIILCLLMIAIVIVTNIVIWWKRKLRRQKNSDDEEPLIT